jgi:carbon monoxide dehydrogenase subunit G
MVSFETSIRIGRPIEEVFALVSDPIQFPRWNSAVQTVRGTSSETGELGSTYSMERELPTGRVENGLEVFAREPPNEFGIRTTSGPTPFVYRYRFVSEGSTTIVHLAAGVELPGVAAMLGPVAARRVRRGVDANFAVLKQTLEEPPGVAGSTSA